MVHSHSQLCAIFGRNLQDHLVHVDKMHDLLKLPNGITPCLTERKFGEETSLTLGPHPLLNLDSGACSPDNVSGAIHNQLFVSQRLESGTNLFIIPQT